MHVFGSGVFAFFALAAYPDTFHATIRVVPGSFGGMTMDTGSVLLVGCELSGGAAFSFRGFFEGRGFCEEPSLSFDSSLLLSTLRFEEVRCGLGGIVLKSLDVAKIWNELMRRAVRLEVCSSGMIKQRRSAGLPCCLH